MARPGETLARQLRDEADRIAKLGYPGIVVHELRAKAGDVSAAQTALDYSKRERRTAAGR